MRHSFRSLVRQPVFTLTAIATLALGIGLNSVIFTFANAVLFRPAPGIERPGELAWIATAWRDRSRQAGLSYPDYVDYRAATRDVFVDLIAFRPTPISLGSGGEPRRLHAHLVSPSYFATLGLRPERGRLIGGAGEGGTDRHEAVISQRLWRERFGPDADMATASVVLNGRVFTVAGVAPEGFVGPALGEAADVWVPLAAAPDLRAADRDLLTNRESTTLLVVGRLRANVTLDHAQAAVSVVASRLEQAYPDSNQNRLALVSSAASGLPPSERSEVLSLGTLLLVTTALVLLIACANVANLLLARGTARASELRLRLSLGATRGRLVRHLLGESAVLASAGVSAGLLLSLWTTELLLAQLPESALRGLDVAIDARVLLFSAALGALSVAVFGLVPALSVTRQRLFDSMRTTATTGRTRLQGGFVVAQLSLALVLLLTAGLSLRTLEKTNAIDVGFNPTGVLTAAYDLELQNYSPEQRVAFRRELRERLAGTPGVSAVGFANVPPLSGTMVSTVVDAVDGTGETVESRAYLNGISAGYFESLQLPIVRGRDIGPSDRSGAPPVAIVNQTLARSLWREVDPVGRTLRLDAQTFEVVGVAQDAKYDERGERPRPFLYTSLDQRSHLERETVIVRTTVAPSRLDGTVRSIFRELDAALPVFDVRPMTDVLRERADKERSVTFLLGGFGGMAVLLAAIGVYGVMAHAASRRTREIGVRIALGATPGQVTHTMVSDASRLALAGLVVGSVLAVPLLYAVEALIFGVQVGEAATFALIGAGLFGVALLAAWLPARAAARVDPVVALRPE